MNLWMVVRFPTGAIYFLHWNIQTGSRPIPPPIQWLPGPLPPGTNLLGRETTHSHLSNAHIKTVWSSNSCSSVFLYIVRTDKLTSITRFKSEGVSMCLHYRFACNTSSFFVTTNCKILKLKYFMLKKWNSNSLRKLACSARNSLILRLLCLLDRASSW